MPDPDRPAWLDELDPDERQRLTDWQRAEPPSAMLAQLSQPSEVPTGWGFQRKWDGMRVLAQLGAETKLWARSGRNVTTSFPDLVDRIEPVDREAIVDGEIVVLRDGKERFGQLQHRMNVEEPSRALVAEIPVQWAVFDVLALDGYDVRSLPQRTRERLLHELAPELGEVILAETVAHGQPPGQVQEAACQLGWEGLIAKDPASTYREGRHRSWRKLKCLQRATFTIVGYRDLEPGGGGVGSLLLAEPGDPASPDEPDPHGRVLDDADQAGLSPVGSVGTGLTDDERTRLRERLQPLRREHPPLAVEDVRGEVRWVDPELTIEVAYSERTPDGNLRHPRLAGLDQLGAREAHP